MKKLKLLPALLTLLLLPGYIQAQQTGTCTAGTEFCESLDTTNNTTTNNTNTNNNTNVNTNTNSNTNVNTNTNSNTNVNTNNNTNTSSNNNVSTNTNVNTNSSTNSNTNVNTSSSNNVNTNNNVNTSNSTSNSTVNSTVNQNVTNESTSNNTNVNTSANTNVNTSTSDSNVRTDNKNVNENNSKSNNTNRNINESNSTQTINQNVKSEAPPASAIAPSIMSYSQDLCTVGRSGAFQGQVFGLSTGRTVTDENCERLKLSKYLYDMGMKVASISLLCADPRVFGAMEMAGTPCPYKGKIGQEATVAWTENKTDRPDYKVWYKEEAAKCKKVWHANSQLKKECIAGLK
jgi:DNA polymerase III alpha subunit (gram-positive type)|tara:strand:+ start:26 stop:1063 length:1038 start_codon:yes stop_codon:yes gene_type:complete